MSGAVVQTSARCSNALKLFHDRLKGAGKLPKVVIVAVMRKMITTLNAMVRDDIAYRLGGPGQGRDLSDVGAHNQRSTRPRAESQKILDPRAPSTHDP